MTQELMRSIVRPRPLSASRSMVSSSGEPASGRNCENSAINSGWSSKRRVTSSETSLMLFRHVLYLCRISRKAQ